MSEAPEDRFAARQILVASLPTGPRSPLSGTPPRRPGSVRRTTSVDQRCAMPGETGEIHGLGRDLLTRPDGSTAVLDEARLDLVIDESGAVASARTEPPVPALEGLAGVPARSGFRARAAELAPEQRAGATVLHQLLDDVPLAALIASYGMTRAHPEWELPPAAAERLGDLCAGWAVGATMLDTTVTHGIFPVPIGPAVPADAPALGSPTGADADPDAWHELPELPCGWVRRVRRLDLWRDADDPALLRAEAYFRDAYREPDGTIEALHEYTVRATLDRAAATIASAEAVAHTLPWPECPGALASAGRIAGLGVGEVADHVRAAFTGTTTCSHLNDQLRSLAGLAALVPALEEIAR